MCGFSKTRSALRHISRRNHGLIWRGRICPFHFFALSVGRTFMVKTLLHRDLPPTQVMLVSPQCVQRCREARSPSFAVRHNQVVKKLLSSHANTAGDGSLVHRRENERDYASKRHLQPIAIPAASEPNNKTPPKIFRLRLPFASEYFSAVSQYAL